MSAELQIAARRAARAAAQALGTSAVSGAALALAAVSVAAAAAWERLAPGAAADAFATSPARWAVALLVVANGVAALSRVLPARVDANGAIRLAPGRGSVGQSLVRGGELLLGIAMLVSLASRDSFDVWLAQGEPYLATHEQFWSRAPPRRWSRGPFQEEFSIGEVRAGGDTGAESLEVIVRSQRRGSQRATRLWPAWFGAGRTLTPIGHGWAVRYELLGHDGAPVETAFAKLRVLPAGRVDEIRLQSVGLRVQVALAIEQPPREALGRAVRARVYRGRTLLADANLLPGEPLVFDGGALRFPEAARWVEFRMVDDRGVPVALASLLLAVTGVLVVVARALRARRAEPSPGPS